MPIVMIGLLRGVTLVALAILLLTQGAWSARERTYIIASGQLSATEQEADEGYFVIANGLALMPKPQTPAHSRLRELRGLIVTVLIRVEEK